MPNMVPRHGTAGVEEKVITQEEPREEPERYIIEGELLYWTNDGRGAVLELGDVPWPGPDIDKCQGKRLRVTVEVLPPEGAADAG